MNTEDNHMYTALPPHTDTAPGKYRHWWASGDGPYFIRLLIGFMILTAMPVFWAAYRSFIAENAKVSRLAPMRLFLTKEPGILNAYTPRWHFIQMHSDVPTIGF